jgi:hypothetical protein
MFTNSRHMSSGFVMCNVVAQFLGSGTQTTVLVPNSPLLVDIRPLFTSNFHSSGYHYHYRIGYK